MMCTDCVIPCLGREQETQRSCHHARMHVTNTSSVPTIRHCLAARPSVPSHHGNGWAVDRDILVHWTDSPAAPQAVLESVSCKCKKCTGARCSCKLNRLTCTGACCCDADDCENRLVTLTDMDVDPLLSEDDSDME